MATEPLTNAARTLRIAHNAIGIAELACLAYLWSCALGRRRDPWLSLSVGILMAEGVALLVARGCPLGIFQRRAGDDVPMFELWFGPKLAPFAIPGFTALAVGGLVTLVLRAPASDTSDVPTLDPQTPNP